VFARRRPQANAMTIANATTTANTIRIISGMLSPRRGVYVIPTQARMYTVHGSFTDRQWLTAMLPVEPAALLSAIASGRVHLGKPPVTRARHCLARSPRATLMRALLNEQAQGRRGAGWR
jgi:hypothetical protein